VNATLALAAAKALASGRRLENDTWHAVAGTSYQDAEGLADGARAAALADGPVTIDLDTTNAEVYRRERRRVY